jgi:bleomycin hydrolase
MHGAVTLIGFELHDVTNMFRNYGAVPQSVYSGLNYGTQKINLLKLLPLPKQY